MSEQHTPYPAEQALLQFDETHEQREAVALLQASRAIASRRLPRAWYDRFVAHYLAEGENGQEAVHAADRDLGRPRRSDASAKNRASKLLRPGQPLRRVLDDVRQRSAWKAGITVEEAYLALRLHHRQAIGAEPMRKSVLWADKETGEILTRDVLIYDPNLAAAGKAVELMGKAARIFDPVVEGDDDRISLTLNLGGRREHGD
jgi:hypothetical protein